MQAKQVFIEKKKTWQQNKHVNKPRSHPMKLYLPLRKQRLFFFALSHLTSKNEYFLLYAYLFEQPRVKNKSKAPRRSQNM